MMKRNFFTSIALAVAVLVSSAVTAGAQTTHTSTTLAATVTTADARQVQLTAVTGVTAPGNGSTLVYLLIDRELMYVTAVDTATKLVTVVRGASSTRATGHTAGVPVWIVPPNGINSYIPSGQCTRANLQYVPFVVGGGPGVGAEVGGLYDCLGSGSAGQWVQTNGTGWPVFGAAVASAASSIAISGTYYKVSGTAAVTGFTLPAGTAPGFCFAVEPTGAFTWTTAGNIILAGSAVVGKVLYFCWNGSKWVPSYIA